MPKSLEFKSNIIKSLFGYRFLNNSSFIKKDNENGKNLNETTFRFKLVHILLRMIQKNKSHNRVKVELNFERCS
jgi:hypothetical protein